MPKAEKPAPTAAGLPVTPPLPLTPRERLAVLREQEAQAASNPDPAPTHADPPEQALNAVPPPLDGDTVVAGDVLAPLPVAAVLPAPDAWRVDVSDIVGGTFTWRTYVVDLSPPSVTCTSAAHAAALRDHLAKLRVDIGLTASPGTLRRMPTLQDQR